ncbi:MAG TPA: hypothetical protein V6C65_15040 [Allocoleopsis sp.]
MIQRYVSSIYYPKRGNPTYLIPRRRVKWGQFIKDCWNWIQERIQPIENPFDRALDEVFNEYLWEAA